MRISFDPVKSERNVRLRQLSFDQAAHFSFESALFYVDDRKEYPETRIVAVGMLGDRLHVLCLPRHPKAFALSASARPTHERSRDMPRHVPLIEPNGEVRELKTEDLRRFRQVSSLPEGLQGKLGVRGPQKAPTKERVTIRLSRHVLESFRSGGDGWQTRVDAALQEWLETHEPSV